MRYRYYVDSDSNTICVSSYAGKPVRGIAKCDRTHDEFNEKDGKDLAKARCDFKIAEKRRNRAIQKYNDAMIKYNEAVKNLDRMAAYRNDASNYLEFAKDQLNEIESKMK